MHSLVPPACTLTKKHHSTYIVSYHPHSFCVSLVRRKFHLDSFFRTLLSLSLELKLWEDAFSITTIITSSSWVFNQHLFLIMCTSSSLSARISFNNPLLWMVLGPCSRWTIVKKNSFSNLSSFLIVSRLFGMVEISPLLSTEEAAFIFSRWIDKSGWTHLHLLTNES